LIDAALTRGEGYNRGGVVSASLCFSPARARPGVSRSSGAEAFLHTHRMESDSQPVIVWNLVPPGSPPPGPELHIRAKQRPFALLKSLEPPRGPDYFPMEKFRRPLRSDGGGATRVGGGGHGGGGGGGDWRSTSKRHGAHGLTSRGSRGSSSSSANKSDQRYTPDVGPSRGLASFSPALSQASSTMGSTPVQRTQTQQAEGLILFDGKAAYSTPARGEGGSRNDRPPLLSHTPIGNSTPSGAPDGGGIGSSGSRFSGGGGLPQFKRTARGVQEEEEEDEDEDVHRRRQGGGEDPSHRAAARGLLSRSPRYLSPTEGMASSPPTPTSHGGAKGGEFSSSPSAHYLNTPSPLGSSSNLAARSDPGSSVATPAGAAATSSARKRPRAPGTAPAGGFAPSPAPAHPMALGGLPFGPAASRSGGGGGGAPATARSWGDTTTNGSSRR
ncbi:unnamed protein product, partial [Scytosiphon promiscuus]